MTINKYTYIHTKLIVITIGIHEDEQRERMKFKRRSVTSKPQISRIGKTFGYTQYVSMILRFEDFNDFPI